MNLKKLLLKLQKKRPNLPKKIRRKKPPRRLKNPSLKKRKPKRIRNLPQKKKTQRRKRIPTLKTQIRVFKISFQN